MKSHERDKVIKWSKSKQNKHVNFIALHEEGSRVLIIEDVTPKGVVIFCPHEGELSIFLTPYNHGKGWGEYVLTEAMNWIERYYPNIGYVWANCGTMKSIKLFRGFGFTKDITGDWFLNI